MRTSVLDWLENAASVYGDRIALKDTEGTLSFAKWRESGQILGSLFARFIKNRDSLAVYMDKGIPALQAFAGCVYAGGFYSVINPALPKGRLLQILTVLSPGLLVTDKAHEDSARALLKEGGCQGIEVLVLEDCMSGPINQEELALRRSLHTDMDPLYANFTSGSTGVPKGVLVGHRSVMDFIDCFTEEFGIDQEDVIANQAPFDFDVSVKDIYSCMKTGARLLIVPTALFTNPVVLLDSLCENEVTTMTWAVSALCMVSTFHGLDYKVPKTVKRILFSGEVMPLKHLKNWMDHLPDTEFVNLYGPTEITCNCAFHRIDRSRSYEDKIPIGKAFPNERVFLLDAEDHLITEEGKSGEICVTGTALALGYYNAKEQTEKSFTLNPLCTAYPERMYRTGDLGMYGADGELYFAGRKDFQIKYQGHRIELEEIDRAMEKIPAVTRCCSIFDAEKEKLYGFYLGDIDKKELHRLLIAELPVYMVPGRLIPLESMPLTKNGKIDRNALLLEGRRRRR